VPPDPLYTDVFRVVVLALLGTVAWQARRLIVQVQGLAVELGELRGTIRGLGDRLGLLERKD
jgi:hypothetical protein